MPQKLSWICSPTVFDLGETTGATAIRYSPALRFRFRTALFTWARSMIVEPTAKAAPATQRPPAGSSLPSFQATAKAPPPPAQKCPGANPKFIYDANVLLFGTDPVAVDAVAHDIIVKERMARGTQQVDARGRSAAFLDIAEGLGLGVAAREKIGIKDVKLG